MKIHRFYLEQFNYLKSDNKEIIISVNEADITHQIKNVFRLKKDSKLILVNNGGEEVEAEIVKINKNQIDLRVIKIKKNKKDMDFKFILHPSIIKKDKLEYVFQKCTEIGVSEFRPIISGRTEKTSVNYERSRKIIKEAVEQSEKNYLPEIKDTLDINNLSLVDENDAKQGCKYYYLDINAKIIETDKLRNEIKKKTIKEINFFIGPEGGWDEWDREIFKKKGIEAVSLGSCVLRAETASIAVSSIILLPEIFK